MSIIAIRNIKRSENQHLILEITQIQEISGRLKPNALNGKSECLKTQKWL